MVKRCLNITIVVLIAVLMVIVSLLYNNNKSLRKELFIVESNQKAFIVENSYLKNKNNVFKFTVEQLNYYSDSLLQEMNTIRRELKVKDKNLKQMQYLLSKAQKRDTVVLKDTIFKDSFTKIDTLLGDKWYQLKLGLTYPNTVITEPKFISEKYIIMGYKKETVNLPKKCFFLRWLQRKHKIVEVEVVEKNPYIKNQQQRFVEIVK